MKKQAVLTAILDRLREDLALYYKAAGAARAEATDEQSKAEHKYDTRGLEASYLARGQSRQAAELEASITQFEKLAPREFGPGEAIDTGALVELKSGGETSYYFLGPRAGGTEVVLKKNEILVITPESPLGSQLLGRKQGEKCQLQLAGEKLEHTVVKIW